MRDWQGNVFRVLEVHPCSSPVHKAPKTDIKLICNWNSVLCWEISGITLPGQNTFSKIKTFLDCQTADD